MFRSIEQCDTGACNQEALYAPVPFQFSFLSAFLLSRLHRPPPLPHFEVGLQPMRSDFLGEAFFASLPFAWGRPEEGRLGLVRISFSTYIDGKLKIIIFPFQFTPT